MASLNTNRAARVDGNRVEKIVYTIKLTVGHGRANLPRVDVEFDPAKSARNAAMRGLPFERALDFDLETATIAIDRRKEYGEVRYVALGYLDDRLHVLCFVTTDRGLRVISLRKANAKEARRHEKPLRRPPA